MNRTTLRRHMQRLGVMLGSAHAERKVTVGSPSAGRSKNSSRHLAAELLEPRDLLSTSSLATGHADSDSHLRYDDSGNAYYWDPPPPTSAEAALEAAAVPARLAPLVVPAYHSNLNASQKIFLDFDGHVVTGTFWNPGNDGNPIHAPAFDTDGDIFTFNQTELNRILDVWERVAEDFAPFAVDVTTEDPGTALFEAGGQGIRVLISTNVDDERLGGTGNQWFDPAGGVAYVDSWDWTTDTPAWVFADRLSNVAKSIAEASSHEVGHTVGLSHDGVLGGDAYFKGHGNWAPIMGNSYNRDVSQWSRGEYDQANNTENDLAIISSRIAYRNDDHDDDASSSGNPTPLTILNGVFSGGGIIERSDDVDAFSFLLPPGSSLIDLFVDPWHNSPNLDVKLQLYNEAGSIVMQSDPADALDAALSISLDGGEYYLAVSGVGDGNPETTGYSDYASLGAYTVAGTVVTTHDDQVGPKVLDVLVGNTQWSADYKDLLPGADSDGFLIPHGADQTKTLPWSNIRQVIVEFTEPVKGSGSGNTLVPGDFELSGINSGAVTISAPVDYDSTANRATLNLVANLQRDRYLLKVDAATVTDLAGNALDGEFTTNQAGPSGNGTPGGSFWFDFNVMPGDLNRDGDNIVAPAAAVDSSDLSILGASWMQTHLDPFYRWNADANADLLNDSSDLSVLGANWMESLPEPSQGPLAAALELAAAPEHEGDVAAAVDAVFAAAGQHADADDVVLEKFVVDGVAMRKRRELVVPSARVFRWVMSDGFLAESIKEGFVGRYRRLY